MNDRHTHYSTAIPTLLALGLALSLAMSGHARADRSGGGGVGNGGGAWTCRSNGSDDQLIWVQLVDLSEARREYGEPVPVTGPMTGPIPTPHDWLAAGDRYLSWAENKIQIASPEFYAEYLRRKADLLNNRILVPAASDFDNTPDTLHHTRPDDSSCPGGHLLAEPEQLANFTTLGNLEISPKLWYDPSLSEIDRAALFVHEVMYWIYRDFGHDTDSQRTRLVVGYLFSATKPIPQYASMITLTPQPEGQQGLPLQYGMYAEITAHYVDIEVTQYDTATRLLTLLQRDRDDHWRAKSTCIFKCEAHGEEYMCNMVSSTRGSPSDWSDRYVRIIDPNNFVWVKLRRDGTVHHATHYSKIK
jgi:hypothetical protein